MSPATTRDKRCATLSEAERKLRHAARQRARYLRHVTAHLCIVCGDPCGDTGTRHRCRSCADKWNTYLAAYKTRKGAR